MIGQGQGPPQPSQAETGPQASVTSATGPQTGVAPAAGAEVGSPTQDADMNALGNTQSVATQSSSPAGTNRNTWSHAQGAAGANPMQTMLSSMVQARGSAQSSVRGPSSVSHLTNPFPKSVSSGALSQESTQVVSGMIEAFMHKVELQPGEKACLENSVGSLTGDVMGTVGDIVTAVQALIQGKGSIQSNQAGGVIGGGIDAAMKISSLVALTTHMVKSCVHGDALILLNQTAQHLINGTYLQHNFIVNGIDIAHGLSDSVVAFEKQDFHRFGTDIGVSLRKILLSTNNNQTQLPEGVPEEAIIQEATQGLMDGFFVQGSAVEITDTAHPDVDVIIDLHQCIAGNSDFFKEIWMALWNLFAQLSINGVQHGFLNTFNMGGNHQPKWAGELMVAMMQFPMAMEKCGVDSSKQKMFLEAVQTLQDLRVHVHMPDDRFRSENDDKKTEETTARMAKAVEDFTKWDFEGFGYEVGKMLRELIILAIPHNENMLITHSSQPQRAMPPPPMGEFNPEGSMEKYSRVKDMKAEDAKDKPASPIPMASAIIGGTVIFMLLARFIFVAAQLSASSSSDPELTNRADHERTSSITDTISDVMSDVEAGNSAVE
jgi:hypothetical protein